MSTRTQLATPLFNVLQKYTFYKMGQKRLF